MERLERQDKRGWRALGRRVDGQIERVLEYYVTVVLYLLQIYDDCLSVSSSHGCVHRNAFTPFVNNRSVSLMNVSENVHLAMPELLQHRGKYLASCVLPSLRHVQHPKCRCMSQ
jgi:hypothetical protein